MSTRMYTLPVDQTEWRVGGSSTATFSWQYDEGRDKLLALYEKGKDRQWNANDRLNWSLEIDPSNPVGFPDEYISIYGSDIWNRLTKHEQGDVRLHLDAWRFSQFLHGEQGALICAAKIVQTVPDLDSKFYAATQVADEARHVEVFSRYLREKIGFAYPINRYLKTLLDQAITDSRWDFTYLAMQVIIEGLALAALGTIRDYATEPPARALNAYVMQDEARHVAFGRLALKDFYPRLTQRERDEREEFAVEACYLMRDRLIGEEIWERLGMDVKGCVEYVQNSLFMQQYRRLLFLRIVPTLKDIGLWGSRIQNAFVEMNVLEFANIDMDGLSRSDDDIAAEHDRLMAERNAYVGDVIARGR